MANRADSAMVFYCGTELGGRIRSALDLAGLSIGQAEKMLGWNRGSLRKCCDGEIVIPGDLLKRLAKICGVLFSWLALDDVPAGRRRMADDVRAKALAKGFTALDANKLWQCLLVMDDSECDAERRRFQEKP